MAKSSAKYVVDEFTGEVIQIMDDHGHEIPDPRPMTVPAGFKRPETLAEQIKRLVRNQISREAADREMETFEEADDFDVDDEFDPSTPYEVFFDPVLEREVSPEEFLRNKEGYIKRYEKAHEKLEAQIGAGTLEDNIMRWKERERLEREALRKAAAAPQKEGGPETQPGQTK